jgi:hypothetical protein
MGDSCNLTTDVLHQTESLLSTDTRRLNDEGNEVNACDNVTVLQLMPFLVQLLMMLQILPVCCWIVHEIEHMCQDKLRPMPAGTDLSSMAPVLLRQVVSHCSCVTSELRVM